MSARRTPGQAHARRVLCALARTAPDVCERLDRAVRDAALAHDHAVTATHEALAEEVLS